ncbi:MSPD2 protein, partial [Polypterus senegalus]
MAETTGFVDSELVIYFLQYNEHRFFVTMNVVMLVLLIVGNVFFFLICCSLQDRERKINETRERFKNEYLAEKYDPRDVEKLQKDDDLVHNYLQWRLFNVDDTLKMIDESFQWRKEYRVNVWFRVKMHVKDAKTASDKKRYVAFWLERYARREPGMPLTVVFDMTESGITNIDDFKYSYPPLPDDDFQTPLCENGPIVSEDDTESKDDAESECRDPLEMSQNEDQLQKTKKVNFLEENLKQAEEKGSGISKTKYVKKPMTTFKGQLLNISPAEELNFGSRDGERKCKIILYNVTKNVVAFKVEFAMEVSEISISEVITASVDEDSAAISRSIQW